jgi:hypothetical protein
MTKRSLKTTLARLIVADVTAFGKYNEIWDDDTVMRKPEKVEAIIDAVAQRQPIFVEQGQMTGIFVGLPFSTTLLSEQKLKRKKKNQLQVQLHHQFQVQHKLLDWHQ